MATKSIQTTDDFNGGRVLGMDVLNPKGAILVVTEGTAKGTVPANTNQTNQIHTGRGILCRVIVTTAAAAAVTIYDGTAASGDVIGVIESGAAAGTIREFKCPYSTGIFIQGASTFPGLTVVFTEDD